MKKNFIDRTWNKKIVKRVYELFSLKCDQKGLFGTLLQLVTEILKYF